MSVREVLLDVAQDRLGFDPSRVPADVMVRFPLSLIRPQLSTGRVSVRLSDVVDGCAEKYRPAFAKSDMESKVNLPVESIFHQLPLEAEPPAPGAQLPTPSAPAPSPFAFAGESVAPTSLPPSEPPAPAPAPAFGAGSPFGLQEAAPTNPVNPPATPSPFGSGLPSFDTPFSAPAVADAGQSLPEAPVSAPVAPSSAFGLPPTPANPAEVVPTTTAAPAAAATENKPSSLWDAPLSPSTTPQSSTPAAPTTTPEPFSSFAGLQPLGGMAPAAGPPPASAPVPAAADFPFLCESEDEAEMAPSGANLQAPWSTSLPKGGSPFSAFSAPAFEDDAVESYESLGKAADEAPEPAPAFAPVESGAFEPVAGFQVARFSEDKEQRSLRALFMSDERFDAQAVVRHCDALPGIDACVLLSRSGEIQASSGAADAGFGAKAASMLGAVISLAESLGLDDAENFSMRTDKGMVSFFRADPVYLGVQHSNKGFAPGVQEKLALATSELARMAGS